MLTKPIYIESLIDTTVEEVWARTQDPAVHQRWDVRFAQIDYLPTVEGEPQRFVYSTTVMPGLTVDGCGETLGERHRPDGTAYSGLKFWSDHPISLIEEGAGYWRYIPAENGVRFLTRYDYRVRWGMFGWIIDRFVFRPIFGFGTAWSFDRLRMWIEEGVSPERSRNNTIATAISMTTLIVGCIAHALSTGFATPGAGQIIAAVLLIASTATTGRNLPSGRRPLRGKADREATVSARPSAFTRSRPFGPGRSGLSAQLPRTQPSTPSQTTSYTESSDIMTTTQSPSIYARALGEDFDRLHPKMQERFGFSSRDGVAHIGSGLMAKMTRGSAVTVPFLKFGTLRNLLFPEHGTDIEFTIENYAYTDQFGRETVTWYRTFNFPGRRRTFDATMIFSDEREQIVDYLGTHQHIAADLDCWVDDEGGINFESGEQRCYEGPFRFRFPRFLTGHARVREWFDDESGEYQISVQVTNPILGHILGYRGSFTNEQVTIASRSDIPDAVIPVREQINE